jgi:hypothetical protein
LRDGGASTLFCSYRGRSDRVISFIATDVAAAFQKGNHNLFDSFVSHLHRLARFYNLDSVGLLKRKAQVGVVDAGVKLSVFGIQTVAFLFVVCAPLGSAV